jgi:hypothetical protein
VSLTELTLETPGSIRIVVLHASKDLVGSEYYKNGDGYVCLSVYRPALGLALLLGCIPCSGWVDPSADHSGCHFLNHPFRAGPKGSELEHSTGVLKLGRTIKQKRQNMKQHKIQYRDRSQFGSERRFSWG